MENLFIFQSFNPLAFFISNSTNNSFTNIIFHGCLGERELSIIPLFKTLFANRFLHIIINVETDLFLKVGKEATDGKIFVS